MPTTHQPAHVARLLKISPTSLRRYAADFADLLPDYSHQRDRKREFSAGDVGMLAAILQEMEAQPEGTTRSQLHDQLTTPGFPPLVPLPILAQVTPGQAQEAAQGEGSSPAPLATTDAAAIVATVTQAADRLSEALESAAAIIAKATDQAAQLEARREARENRAERLQWAMLAILTVATVAAVLLLAIK